MYAAGAPYHSFAGRDVSYALAKMSLKEEDIARGGDSDLLAGLSPQERSTLNDWEVKFRDKKRYPFVGRLLQLGATSTD